MKKSIFIALFITVIAFAWIFSGTLQKDKAPLNNINATNEVDQNSTEDTKNITDVRVRNLSAQTMKDTIEITGRTKASRQVMVAAETQGQIETLNVEKGAYIKAGQVIAKLKAKDRHAKLDEAKQLLKQREIQFRASKELNAKGYNSKVKLAQTKAELETARALVKQAQEELRNIIITAPFSGIVNQQLVEIGDFVTTGEALIEIVDLKPIKISGFLTEKQISHVKEGDDISAILLNNVLVDGEITFIAAAADIQTRTFEMEMTVDNEDSSLKEGLTAKILVPYEQENAYKISPSILSLADDGQIGVKIVNAQNIVEFKAVELLKDTPDYLWVAGLPNTVRVITVGQEFVIEGQEVNPIQSNDKGGLL